MAITEEQVKHVAKLSKLSFSEEELADFTNQLDKIIDMVELLEEVDTTGMDRKELMRNVPESENGYIKVPAIMDNGEAGA